MAKKILTVYIGRFQPFHLGHEHVLKQALSVSDITVVLIGSAFQARTIKNPFTYEERADLINSWHAYGAISTYNKKLVTLPLRDQPYNDAKWIQSVQEQVDSVLSSLHDPENYEVRLTGSDRDDSTWYLSAFPQWKITLQPEFKRPPDCKVSATSVREIMYGSASPEALSLKLPVVSATFITRFLKTEAAATLRAEWAFMKKYKQAWSVAPYEPIFSTVDAVVIQSGHVLVVERGALPGRGLWALPGGFLDPKERLQKAVIRELVEETGIKVPAKVLEGSIKAKEIFDDPNRSLRGRTITTAFLIRLDDTQPLPKVKGQNAPLHETGGVAVVETAKAFWLPIHEARSNSDRWFEDHAAILDTMIGLIKD